MRLNVQAEARRALEEALDADVRVTVPRPRPDRFVLVRREGGSLDSDTHRDIAGVGVDCWAPTEQAAYELAEAAREAMMALPLTADGVAKVVEEAFYSSPDPEDDNPRWYGSYTVTAHEIF